MGAVCIVVFSFPVPSKKKLVVVEGTVGGEAIANVSVEKTDHPIDEEGAPEKTAHVVEENAAAQDLEPIQGEEYVAEGALTPESLKSQKRLAWYSLAFGSLIFRIVSSPIPFLAGNKDSPFLSLSLSLCTGRAMNYPLNSSLVLW